MQIYVTNGTMSRRTMMEQCPYIADVDEEQKRIDEENQADDDRERLVEEDQMQRQAPNEDLLEGIYAREEEASDDGEVE